MTTRNRAKDYRTLDSMPRNESIILRGNGVVIRQFSYTLPISGMYSPMGHDVLVLRSYDTIVAYYDLIYKEMVVCENAYNLSPTTTRHISCFKDFISNLEGDYTLYDAEPHEVGCWVYGW